MTSTIVFVDVDGVINADDRGLWNVDTWRRRSVFLRESGVALRIQFSTALIDGLRGVEALPGVEMRWLTTWGQSAPWSLARKIGMGAHWLYSEPGDDSSSPLGWWKADVVHAAVSVGHRVAWLDDDIDSWARLQGVYRRPDRLEWMDPERLHTVCPESRIGLQSDELGDLLTWLKTGKRVEDM